MFDVVFQPVFADAGAVVGLLVLIFTVVGWLVNLANSQNNPPAPPQNRPRPPRPGGERAQNEIDIFLQEVRGENRAEQAEEEEEIYIESLPPEPRRRPNPATPPPPPAEPPDRRSAQRARLAPHVDARVGETLSSHHLESQFGPPPESLDVPDPRTTGEMAALQSRGGGGKAAKQPALPIVQMLRNQQGLRQAILVNEILSKPKSLREE